MSTLPDRPSAKALANELVEARLATCVNVLAPCLSVYRWQDKVEAATEMPLLIKTRSERYAALEAAIREQRHPDDVPEVIALPVVAGLPDYLAWVAAETRTPDDLPDVSQ